MSEWKLITERNGYYYWRKLMTSQEMYNRTKVNYNGGFIYNVTKEKVKPSTEAGWLSLEGLLKIKGELK